MSVIEESISLVKEYTVIQSISILHSLQIAAEDKYQRMLPKLEFGSAEAKQQRCPDKLASSSCSALYPVKVSPGFYWGPSFWNLNIQGISS